jgi:Icc-related predicted phosphoesterase
MKIVSISDTHNELDLASIPQGDLLIHAGDATNYGTAEELMYFFSLFCSLPHKHKVFLPGNHDCLFDSNPELALGTFKLYRQKNDHVLINSAITINKIKIFGFPYIPRIRGAWGFEKTTEGLNRLADSIPLDIDLLITHSPPFNTLDRVPVQNPKQDRPVFRYCGITGMSTDSDFYSKRSNLKTVVCGHIHEDYGVLSHGNGVTFYNSALHSKNQPHVFYL